MSVTNKIEKNDAAPSSHVRNASHSRRAMFRKFLQDCLSLPGGGVISTARADWLKVRRAVRRDENRTRARINKHTCLGVPPIAGIPSVHPASTGTGPLILVRRH